MPSAEDCANARNEVRQHALAQLLREGHPKKSAEMIVDRMTYDEQVQLAEKYTDQTIYRGPYSAY